MQHASATGAPSISHANCQPANLIDPHYSQQNTAAAASDDAAGTTTGSHFKGGSAQALTGRCNLPGSLLSRRLEKQQKCNAELIQRAVSQLRGRSLIFIGDSLMFQQWMSTLTMMAYALGDLKCPRLAQVYHNGYQSLPPFICAQTSDWNRNVAGLRLCHAHRHPWHSNLAKTMEMTKHHWTANDTILMNAGVWHRNEFNRTERSITDVLRYARKQPHHMPTLFWRETSPQHFVVPYEEQQCVDRGICSFRNTAAPTYSAHPHCSPCSEADWKGCITGKQHNEVAQGLLAGQQSVMKIVHIWNGTVPDWHSHLGYIQNRENQTVLDCTHYCLPSPTVNAWTLELYAEMTQVMVQHSC